MTATLLPGNDSFAAVCNKKQGSKPCSLLSAIVPVSRCRHRNLVFYMGKRFMNDNLAFYVGRRYDLAL